MTTSYCLNLDKHLQRCQEGQTNPFDLDAVRDSRPEIYHQSRRGSLRRPLAIINPIHFAGLADFIVRNWDALKLAACKSPFSLTSPEIGRDGRAIGRKFPFEVLAERRAGVRSRGKILVRADISRFLPLHLVSEARYPPVFFGPFSPVKSPRNAVGVKS
jgi:hypothetical protein